MDNAIWTANGAAVAAERFGEEVVAIHFESGRYVSLGGGAAWLWECLAVPRRLDDLAAHPGAGAALAMMREAGLLLPAEAASALPLPPVPDPWPAPRIEIFSDLADLIALDPVHEVDAMMGWPRRADAGA